MNLNSKLFDKVRIRSRHPEPEARVRHACDWEGCTEEGIYRAPKGHRTEGDYHNFCLEHVRHYNTAFNFFAGMNADEVEEHVSRSAQTDGRPSWGFGAKAGAASGPRMPRGKPADPTAKRFNDPLNIFARYAWSQSKAPQQRTGKAAPRARPPRPRNARHPRQGGYRRDQAGL